MRQLIFWSTSVLLVLALGACATSNPDVVQRGDAQQMSKVEDGVLLSFRPVVVDGSQSGVGSVAGAVVGGVAGGSLGGYRENIIGGVIGAVVGGVVGNAVERVGTREDAYELLIQLKGGERRAVVQAKGSETFVPGDAVLLITTSGKVRVVRAPR